MLTRRVIVTLTLNEGSLYRTKNFNPDRLYTMNFVDMEMADEIIILDVTRQGQHCHKSDGSGRRGWIGNCSRARQFSESLFLPLAMGGGITSVGDAAALFRNYGSDKVVVNTEAFRRPEFITELAERFGSQSVVVSIDSRDGEVYVDRGQVPTGAGTAEWAKKAAAMGAGEIYLMDCELDGSLQGYNFDLLEDVLSVVAVPVIISGGCGGWHHMDRAFRLGADACSTSCIFHFTKTSLIAAKQYLADRGHEVRL